MKCLIICSSNEIDVKFLKNLDKEEYYIICADGGLEIVQDLGITPDLWVGDMDSSKLRNFSNIEKLVYPCDKDLTDSHIAVNEALKRGYKEIVLTGATGGRLDHEYANLCLLKYILKSGGFGKIVNKNNSIIMTDKKIEIEPMGMKYISFFPFGGEVRGFTVKDVKYELKNHLLVDYDTYTTSNEFISGKTAKIYFESGYVIIICTNDC